MNRPRIITAVEAAALIPDNVTVATGGFLDIGFPNAVVREIGRRFIATARPYGLTLVHAAGQARIGHFAHLGLIKRVISGYYGWSKEMQRLVLENQIEAYNLPQGVIVNLYRDIAARRIGHWTMIGQDTFVDPMHGGPALNELSQTYSPVGYINGQYGLRYKTFPIHVALIRGWLADADGNIWCSSNRLNLETLSLAMAARNSGGMVIAQVDTVSEARLPSAVFIPRMLVDYIVPDRGEPLPALPQRNKSISHAKLAERASREARDGDVINIGIGLPETVAPWLARKDVILTTESGSIGGVPGGGANFGGAEGMEAAIDAGYQFDFYNGGGLDCAFLGFAEIDRAGNVNASKFGGRLQGCGGFIDISQSAKRIVFVGVEEANGKSKFVENVEHMTFSADYARRKGTDVKYVTDKGVYALGSSGPEKVE